MRVFSVGQPVMARNYRSGAAWLPSPTIGTTHLLGGCFGRSSMETTCGPH